MAAKTLRVNWLQAAIHRCARYESLEQAAAAKSRRLTLTAGEIDAIVYLGVLDNTPEIQREAARAVAEARWDV